MTAAPDCSTLRVLTASGGRVVEGMLERELVEPYLPRLVSSWLTADPDVTHHELDATVAFVDISGFTKLSERLARRGRVGAEEITEAIGTCFRRLLDVAHLWGGGLLKFGGDALLLLFDGVDHQVAATHAAVGMRRTLREVGRLTTSAGRINLRMSVGVHSGTFHFFLVGGAHRELLITGPAASTTVLMESTATANEIVVSPETAAALPRSVVGRAKGPGYLIRRAPPSVVPDPQPYDLETDHETLLRAVPVAIREHLVAGIQPEHRPVTVAFLHFDGTDALIGLGGAAAAVGALDRLVRTVQEAADEHEVAFLASDVDRDGGKIILTSGAPRVTGQDEERLLLAVRHVLDADLPVPVRAGINRGYVFAGEIGTDYRRTYTVMGDAVNLAARVMAEAAPGQLLATRDVLRHSRLRFTATPLPEFAVKGKSQPVSAVVVGAPNGVRVSPTARTPFVGRELELAMLRNLVEGARSGSGVVIEVSGEAGIGKSRLVEEVSRLADGLRPIVVTCERYESTTPYVATGRLLRHVLGVADGDGEAATEARLRTVVRDVAPHLEGWLPLLAVPLQLELPPTPETGDLEPRFRRPRLAQVLNELLRRLLHEPLLAVFEDAHWIDEPSGDLLRRLAPAIAEGACAVMVVRRDLVTHFDPPEGTIRLGLEPLDRAAANRLVVATTADAPLAQHQIDLLVERAAGNPLFLEELVAAVTSSDHGEGLPDSVETLLLSRVDRLGPHAGALLRRLSVLGTEAAWELVPAVLEDDLAVDDDPRWDQLDEFLEVVPGGSVRFRRSLLRDVAYGSLPFAQRRELHGRAGDLIQRSTGGDADEAELLSFHFAHAERHPEAWRYSRIAAARASEMYANVDAAEFYRRAIRSGLRTDAVEPGELALAYESLGDVHDRMGAFNEAAEAYRAARRFLPDDAIAQSRLMLKVGWERGWLGRYSEALRWITRGLKLLAGADGPTAAEQRAQLEVWYARFRQEQGRHDDAIEWAWRAIADGEAAGDREALAHAYKVLDWAYVDLGRTDQAVHAPRALALYEELGDLSGQAAVLNNLGGNAYWQGRWSEALELYERARDLWERTGDEVGVAFAAGNIGEILSGRGQLDEAERLFQEAARLHLAAGLRSRVAFAKRELGRVALRSGRFDEALQLYIEVRAELEDIGAKGEVVETDARIAECHLFLGDPEAALAIATATLTSARNLGGVAAQMPYLERTRGYALMQLGRVAEAHVALQTSLADARMRDADHEAALTLRALADLARLEERDGDADGLLEESREILDRLGVVGTLCEPGPRRTTVPV